MTSTHPIPHAAALMRVLREAEDIAKATAQRTNSAHALLAMFTTKNHAERLLRDRGIDEDRLLELISPEAREPKHVMNSVSGRAAQVAAGCGAREVDCLHFLVAITREREAIAYRLLEATGEKLGLLRTRALTILTGAVPRWLEQRGSELPSKSQIGAGLGANVEVEALSMRPGTARAALNRAHPSRIQRVSRRAALDWSPPIVAPGPGAKKRGVQPMTLDELEAKHRARQSQHIDAQPPESPASDLPADEEIGEALDRALELGDPLDDEPGHQWTLSPSEFPWLTSLGRNLSAEAARGEIDPLIGRKKEVAELIDILGKRRANNPCLIGEPGVGKTAVVEGLALQLVSGQAGAALAQKIIVQLDVGALLVGTHLRGSFSEKLQGLKEEVKTSGGRVIVFFDELHTLVGAGSTGDGPQDAANELKAALARGDFPSIGATTRDEYIKHIEPDAALKRRFYPVLIKEPSPQEAIEMMHQIAPAYAQHHRVAYADEALAAAVNLSSRYITDRHLPDKAIALIDLAGSRAARAGSSIVSRELVASLVSEQTELPIERLLSSDRERLLELEKHLQAEVVGHRKQLHRIAEVIRRNAAGFTSRRPQGVFLFVGPTGVGKTETAKAIAKVLHGSEDRMLRFDLSEFSEAHAVARLVGAPPGYVGHDAGGQLTEAVRRKPGRVILFDEIEKAHRDVLQLLLQILDEGRLTDGRGQTVSFAETIVVMTSNLGADLARTKRPIGFAGATAEERAQLEDIILGRAREALAPELWGRIEEKLVFAPLARDEIREIARLLSSESSRRLLRERGITYALDDRAIDYLVEQGGYDVTLGARPMRQILARIVEAPIAARILEGRLHADEHVRVTTRASGGLGFFVGEENQSLSQRPRI